MKNNLLFCISMIMAFSIWPGLTQTAYAADNPCYIIDVQFNDDNIIETNIIIDNIKASVGSFALDYDASVVRMVYKVEDYSIEKYKIVQQDTDFDKIGEQESGISTFINDDVQWIDTNQGYYMFNWYGNKGTIDAIRNAHRIQTLYFEILPGASKADINTNTFRLVSDYKILSGFQDTAALVFDHIPKEYKYGELDPANKCNVIFNYPDNVYLRSLELSSGTLEPAFDEAEVLYGATVENNIEYVEVTATVRDADNASVIICVNEKETAGGNALLNAGDNKISVIVTGEHGTVREYTVILVRKEKKQKEIDEKVKLVNALIDWMPEPGHVTDEVLISIKSSIENALMLYKELNSLQQQVVTFSRKDKLEALYKMLLGALNYKNVYEENEDYVEAVGLVTKVDRTQTPEKGEKVSLELKVEKLNNIEHPKPKEKFVIKVYDIYIKEVLEKESGEKIEKDVKPKANKAITVKIKVPADLEGKKGLDIVYIDKDGNMESQNASLINENGEKFLVFEAKHFSKYAIVCLNESVPPSTNSGSRKGSSGLKISVVQHQAYITGYPDHSFRPDSYITRAEAAVVLTRLLPDYNPNQVYHNKFIDVSINSWYYQYIGFMCDKKLISGYTDGTFKPDNNMTRAEFAVLIARFSNIPVSGNCSGVFVDTNGHWAKSAISVLLQNGYLQGYGDGTFKPENPITRAEAVTIINAVTERKPDIGHISANLYKYTLNINDIEGHWAYYEIIEALVTHSSNDFH